MVDIAPMINYKYNHTIINNIPIPQKLAILLYSLHNPIDLLRQNVEVLFNCLEVEVFKGASERLEWLYLVILFEGLAVVLAAL
jgi:hypothetical protein